MKLKVQSLLKNDFIRGSIIFTLIGTIGSILNYFFNFLAGRALGPAGYGEIVSFNSYLMLTALPITIVSTTLIQKISSSGDKRMQSALMLEEYFIRKLKRWWFIIVLPLLLTPLIPSITNLSLTSSYLLIPSLIISLFSSFYFSALQGLRMFFIVAIISLMATIIKLSGAVIAAYAGAGYSIIVFGISLSILFSYASYLIAFKRPVTSVVVGSKARYEKRLLEIISRPWFISSALSLLAMNLFSSFDILFAKKFFPAGLAGIYGSWNLFAKIILYVIGPIIPVSFVFFSSREKNQDKTLYVSLSLLLIAGICGFIAYTYFSDIIIFLFFGKKFVSVGPYLTYASIFGSLYAIITFFNTYFLAKKSLFSLVLPIGIPFYLIAFFLVPKTILSIIFLNIFFSAVIVSIYLMVLTRQKILSKK